MAVTNKNVFAQPTKFTPVEEIGVLDIHGAPRWRTWTKVQSTVVVGSNVVVTAEVVDFDVGDKLVVTSTVAFQQTEEVTVVSRGTDNRTLTITPVFKFTHESSIHTIEGRTVDMRCEIGLLSRNVVIQGDDSSAADQVYESILQNTLISKAYII